MLAEPNCHKRKCVHFEGVNSPTGDEVGQYVYCLAFPKGIPKEIAYGVNPHTEVQNGQEGDYVYERKK